MHNKNHSIITGMLVCLMIRVPLLSFSRHNPIHDIIRAVVGRTTGIILLSVY